MCLISSCLSFLEARSTKHRLYLPSLYQKVVLSESLDGSPGAFVSGPSLMVSLVFHVLTRVPFVVQAVLEFTMHGFEFAGIILPQVLYPDLNIYIFFWKLNWAGILRTTSQTFLGHHLWGFRWALRTQ